jgi:hypothetical protein
MCILAETGMFFEHKWATHVALLHQNTFVLVYGWFWVDILAMVWNGPLNEYYHGRTTHVLPMQTVVTLGSNITPKAPNPSKTNLKDLKWCFYMTVAVGTPFVHKKCGIFFWDTQHGLCCAYAYFSGYWHVLSTQVGGPC